jgi:hypothetical protein
MTAEATYEYLVFAKDDNLEEVNKHVQALADVGWEMVSGAATSWLGQSSEWPSTNINVWHTKYVTYWRRPRLEPDSAMT